MSDMEFARYLTVEVGVAGIPLSPFTDSPELSSDLAVRFCFAKKDETLDEAGRRLAAIG
jgi:methionine aminotransferase